MVRKASSAVSNDAGASSPPRVLSEEEVLQSAPRVDNTDDWPIYLLTNAVVYGKDPETPVNLLHAELDGPFTVRGQLRVEAKNKGRCE